MNQPAVYIVSNKKYGVLYTGVTSDLNRRAFEHAFGTINGFSQKYKCKLLVYCERIENMTDAILREKQIKAGSRAKKLALIKAQNPEWKDLQETLL